MRGEQLYIEGTEPKTIPEIEEAIRNWNHAKADRKDAGERVRLHHATLSLRMTDHGIEKYPYVDDKGDKRMAVRGSETKISTKNAPKGAGRRRGRKKKGREEDPDQLPPAAEATPEHSDPFGSTRRALDEKATKKPTLLEQAKAKQAEFAKSGERAKASKPKASKPKKAKTSTGKRKR